MSTNDIVDRYMHLRDTSSVAEATSETIKQLSITPSDLVDSFNAVQFDFHRSNEEAEIIRDHRNELLSHFRNNQQY